MSDIYLNKKALIIISEAIVNILHSELAAEKKQLAEQTLTKVNKHINARSPYSYRSSKVNRVNG